MIIEFRKIRATIVRTSHIFSTNIEIIWRFFASISRTKLLFSSKQVIGFDFLQIIELDHARSTRKVSRNAFSVFGPEKIALAKHVSQTHGLSLKDLFVGLFGLFNNGCKFNESCI